MYFESGRLVETVDFPFDEIDRALGVEPPEENDDAQFWRFEGEMVGEILRWLTEIDDDAAIDGRLRGLAHVLCPGKFATPWPTASQLSEAKTFLLQRQIDLPPDYYRKIASLRDRRAIMQSR